MGVRQLLNHVVVGIARIHQHLRTRPSAGHWHRNRPLSPCWDGPVSRLIRGHTASYTGEALWSPATCVTARGQSGAPCARASNARTATRCAPHVAVWQDHLPIVRRKRASVPAELGVRSAAVGASVGAFAPSWPASITPADEIGTGHRPANFRLPSLAIDPRCLCAVRVASVAIAATRRCRYRPHRGPSPNMAYPCPLENAQRDGFGSNANRTVMARPPSGGALVASSAWWATATALTMARPRP
jgi:hypothetical protein